MATRLVGHTRPLSALRVTSRQLSRSISTTRYLLTINKVVKDVQTAIENSGLKSGDLVLSGGFGLCGIPQTIIRGIEKNPQIKDLTVASNNCGVDSQGLGILLESGQISKLLVSYVGENKAFEKMYLKGKVDLELTPQGTLAARVKAAAAGIPAFYTPAGVNTYVESGELPIRYNEDGSVAIYSKPKETREFKGRKYLLEEALFGDVAIVKVERADFLGNCVFSGTAENFNGIMARAARYTIVEADDILPVGSIPPHHIHIPGIYVNAVVKATEKKLFERVVYARSGVELANEISQGSRQRIIKRAAQEFTSGMYANLGIGIPTLAPNFVSSELGVQLQSENGVLGVGAYPVKGQEHPDYINAGKETITLAAGASVFSSDESFGMIRSGQVNMSMLGAMQVSQYGDLANWMLPGKVKGMGGAMDLVSTPPTTKIVVTMEHCDKNGKPKIVGECTFPLTGTKCVSRIITDLAVFDVDREEGLTLIEIAQDVSVDELRLKTGADFIVSDGLKTMD